MNMPAHFIKIPFESRWINKHLVTHFDHNSDGSLNVFFGPGDVIMIPKDRAITVYRELIAEDREPCRPLAECRCSICREILALSPSPELRAAILELTKNEPPNRRLVAQAIAEKAMLAAIEATREVFAYANAGIPSVTAATNNWEIGRKILARLERNKCDTPSPQKSS